MARSWSRQRAARTFVENLEARLMFCALHEPLAAGFTGEHVETNGFDSHVFTPAGQALTENVKSQAFTAWTMGNKTVLYIRVTFADKPTSDPQSASDATAMMQNVSSFMLANSFGQTSMTATVTDLIVLPQTEAYYNTAGDFQLRTDALAAAAAANPAWNYLNYNLDATRWNGGPGGYAGQAYVGSRGVWLKSSSAGVADHEFGHNLGLWHANYFVPNDRDTVIGPGTNTEYGDVFDTMGAAGGGAQQFNDYEKNLLGWIPDDNVSNVTAAGTYRIYANDLYDQGETFDASHQYGIKIRKDSDRDYWLDFRQAPSWLSSNQWIASGVGVRWDQWAGSNLGSQWLDTNPNSPAGRNDGAVVIGRTFTDDVSDIHITPIAKGTDSAHWIDVQVNFGDPNATGDRAPTVQLSTDRTSVAANATVSFTAAASDLDGDALAYYWDFGDGKFGTNTPTASKSWSAAGEYRVRLTVSDMKGRTTSTSVIVNVANATAQRVSGRVVDAAGNPVADVRVHNGLDYSDGNYRYAYTDADGFYTLTGVPTGTTYAMGAAKPGFTFATQGFSNPVSVGAANVNFVATARTYHITGKITADGTTPLAGATVSNGIANAITDAAGNYTLDALLGLNTVTVAKSGYNFPPASVASIEYTDATLNISALTYTVFGRITGAPVGTVITVTDGETSRTITISSQEEGTGGGATGFYSLTIRPGLWNLTASANGMSFSPVGWSNPLNVTSSVSQTYHDFATDPVRLYAATGRILSTSGQPMTGVTVSAGSFQSTTDLGGRFALTGLPAGDYTFNATQAGHSFGPASRTVSFAAGSADASGQDFSELAGAAIVGRHVFYNNSAFDNNDASANAFDDGAIASDKSALVKVGTRGAFANVISYDKGINGVMMDVSGLPPRGAPVPGDFGVDVSLDGINWTAGPGPTSVTVRSAGGITSFDRVTLIWPDNSIKNKWLRLTMKATTTTGLITADVSYWGSAVGDTGNGLLLDATVNVDATDYYAVRDHLRSYDNPAPVVWNWDLNRDGVTDATDLMLVRSSATTSSSALQLITVRQSDGPTQAGSGSGNAKSGTPSRTAGLTTITARRRIAPQPAARRGWS